MHIMFLRAGLTQLYKILWEHDFLLQFSASNVRSQGSVLSNRYLGILRDREIQCWLEFLTLHCQRTKKGVRQFRHCISSLDATPCLLHPVHPLNQCTNYPIGGPKSTHVGPCDLLVAPGLSATVIIQELHRRQQHPL